MVVRSSSSNGPERKSGSPARHPQRGAPRRFREPVLRLRTNPTRKTATHRPANNPRRPFVSFASFCSVLHLPPNPTQKTASHRPSNNPRRPFVSFASFCSILHLPPNPTQKTASHRPSNNPRRPLASFFSVLPLRANPTRKAAAQLPRISKPAAFRDQGETSSHPGTLARNWRAASSGSHAVADRTTVFA